MSSSKQLLFFSLEDWSEIRRRNQFVCRLLHDRHPDAEILWVGPAPYMVHRIRYFQKRQKRRFPPNVGPLQVPDYSRIHFLLPYKVVPNSLGRVLNQSLILKQILNSMHSLGWSSPTVWVNNHGVRPLLPAINAQKLIYDITDDWTQCTMSDRQSRTVVSDDSWLTEHSDEVIVCSPGLYDLKRRVRESLHLVRNGVDSEHFSPQALAGLLRPDELAHVQSPIVGYTGTLHEDRLDIDLVADLCRNNPAMNFVFVGPDCLSAESRGLLESFSNCHLIGRRHYNELPRYIAAFDVCMTPHKVTPFTESLDPIKLYEYLSTGKPVIATPCAGFRESGELVSLARDASTFGRAIHAVLENHKSKAAQLRWAAENSWLARVKQIERILGWELPQESPLLRHEHLRSCL